LGKYDGMVGKETELTDPPFNGFGVGHVDDETSCVLVPGGCCLEILDIGAVG
jgi:hypothetical protein